VEQWAEVRRLFFVRGLSQREVHRRTGLHRDTIRNADQQRNAAEVRARAGGIEAGSVNEEIHRLLKADPRLRGQRIRELITPIGFDGGTRSIACPTCSSADSTMIAAGGTPWLPCVRLGRMQSLEARRAR